MSFETLNHQKLCECTDKALTRHSQGSLCIPGYSYHNQHSAARSARPNNEINIHTINTNGSNAQHIIEKSDFPIFLLPIPGLQKRDPRQQRSQKRLQRIPGPELCLRRPRDVLLCPELVVSILGDVTNPREGLVATLLNDL